MSTTETNPVTTWHRGDWMQTYSGKQFYPLSPDIESIFIEDIAHALSLICRYGGHIDRFYSVAEHCVLTSSQMPTPELALSALLHDATEAYVGDMVRPLKLQIPQYRQIEDDLMDAIALRFGLPTGPAGRYTMPAEVKSADSRILLDERAALMSGKVPAKWAVDGLAPLGVAVTGWDPRVAERAYLRQFVLLSTEVGLRASFTPMAGGSVWPGSPLEKLLDAGGAVVTMPGQVTPGGLPPMAPEFEDQLTDEEWKDYRLGLTSAALSEGEWADYFERADSVVGGKSSWTSAELAQLFRGPRPFGIAAADQKDRSDG